MGNELNLKQIVTPEDIAEYFYQFFEPSLLNHSFPTKKEAEELLHYMEGHSYVLHYDVKSGKLYCEDVDLAPGDDSEHIEEYSFERAVEFCMDLADEFLTDAECKGEDRTKREEELRLFATWHYRMCMAGMGQCAVIV